MEIDTEPQMVASILAKKKTVGRDARADRHPGRVRPRRCATHDGGRAASRRSSAPVAAAIDLRVEIVDHRGARADRPRHRAAARGARRARGAARASRTRRAICARSRSTSRRACSRWSARCRRAAAIAPRSRRSTPAPRRAAFERIVAAQGRRELPAEAPHRAIVAAPADGRIREIDCWEIARVAKRAGAPANVAAGVRLLRTRRRRRRARRAALRDPRAERGAARVRARLRGRASRDRALRVLTERGSGCFILARISRR